MLMPLDFASCYALGLPFFIERETRKGKREREREDQLHDKHRSEFEREAESSDVTEFYPCSSQIRKLVAL